MPTQRLCSETVGLLRDVADAFKHHRPDRPSATVRASSDSRPAQHRLGSGPLGRRQVGRCRAGHHHDEQRRQTRAVVGPSERFRCLDDTAWATAAADQPVLAAGRPRLPKDLPPKSTVWAYFDLWTWDGTLERIHHALYVAVREL
jgi:hypothetical protein